MVGEDMAVAREVRRVRWGGSDGGMPVSALLPLKLTVNGNFVVLGPAILKPTA